MKSNMDYRQKYKNYYGIDFGKEYVIHHIDLDRTNNDISNLLLLPRKLHSKYHMILTSLRDACDTSKSIGFIDLRLSNTMMLDCNYKILSLLPETINECNKWIWWKKAKYAMDIKDIIFGG